MSDWIAKNGIEYPEATPSGDAGTRLKANFQKLADRAPNMTAVDPTANDDSGDGFVAGSRWLNTTTLGMWICTDSSLGNAIWQELYRWSISNECLVVPGDLDVGGTLRGNGRPIGDIQAVAANGTAAILDSSYALLDFGTTDPVLTLAETGRYLLFASANLAYSGSVSAEDVGVPSFKIRRTNNSAADVSGSTVNVWMSPAYTDNTASGAGTAAIQAIPYTSAGTGDVLELWGVGGSIIAVTGATLSAMWLGP